VVEQGPNATRDPYSAAVAEGVGQLADRERPFTAEPKVGAGRAALSTAAYVLRQLAGCLVFIVLVWLAVMLYRHAQAVAIGLAHLVV
jgi:hypothetical protein